MPSISFQTLFFVQAFKIVVDSLNFSMLLLKILWDDWLFFNDFRFKWTATAAIGIHPTKVWLSQLVNFKNAIWTWGHFRKTICNTFCFKLWKMPQKHMTAFGASCMNRALVFEWHKRFKEGSESVRDYERCGMSKNVNTPELIGQSVRVRVTVLRFYGSSGRDS